MPACARRDVVDRILDRFGVDRSNWVQTVREFGRMFKRAAGRANSLTDAAPLAALVSGEGGRASCVSVREPLAYSCVLVIVADARLD